MNASEIVTGADAAAAATGREDLIDRYLPGYDLAITEHLVVQANPEAPCQAAAELDFLTVRSPLLSAASFVRDVPARLRDRAAKPSPELRLAAGTAGLLGWVYLGDVPGLEIAFGAVGKFWQPSIEWHDVPAGQFAGFAEPGWDKIACHFLIRSEGWGVRLSPTSAGPRRPIPGSGPAWPGSGGSSAPSSGTSCGPPSARSAPTPSGPPSQAEQSDSGRLALPGVG